MLLVVSTEYFALPCEQKDPVSYPHLWGRSSLFTLQAQAKYYDYIFKRSADCTMGHLLIPDMF